MEILVLRLVLPPLTVLVAGWLQNRAGPRLSGRLVGLPLASGPLVLVLLLEQGPSVAAAAAQGALAGQVMVLGFACAYAFASTRRTPLPSLGAAVVFTAALGAGARVATEALPWVGLAVLPVALIALRLWRTEPSPATAPARLSGTRLASVVPWPVCSSPDCPAPRACSAPG